MVVFHVHEDMSVHDTHGVMAGELEHSDLHILHSAGKESDFTYIHRHIHHLAH